MRLRGNSSVNTVHYARLKEAVFSMSSAPSNSRNGVLCDQLLRYATVFTTELCFLCGPCSPMWRRGRIPPPWPCDSDPRKTALARTSSIHKRQTRPLVREGAPQKQDRNCQTVINTWFDWPLVAMWLWLWFWTKAVTRVQLRKVTESSRGGSTRTEWIATRSTEEYRRSSCEDLTCDLKTLCVI
jgi:hypothetical protein